MKDLNEKRPSGLALIPFAVFIVIYMGAGIYYQVKGADMAFYQFPSVTAMFLAVLTAFAMFKGSINEKFETFAKGAANVDILTMLMIYILAGAFASVAAAMGGRESTVNLGLSLLSPDLDFNSFKLGSFAPVFYLNGVLGSVAVLELLRWLEARISLRPLIWCGRHSMFLMATHLPWQIAPELVMLGKRFYLAQTPTAPYFLMMLAEFAVLMLIEAALVWCKEKVKAAMTGRWGKERPICKAVKYL